MLIDWRRRMFDMASQFQDGGRDVISCRKVLTPGECLPGIYAAASASSWSILHSYLFSELGRRLRSASNEFLSPAFFVKAKVHYPSFPITSWCGQKSVVSVVSCRFPNSITTTCCQLVADLLAKSWRVKIVCRLANKSALRNKLATFPSTGKLRLRGNVCNGFWACTLCCIGGRFYGRWSSVDSDPVHRLAWSRSASTRRVTTGHTTYGQIYRSPWSVHPCSLQVTTLINWSVNLHESPIAFNAVFTLSRLCHIIHHHHHHHHHHLFAQSITVATNKGRKLHYTSFLVAIPVVHNKSATSPYSGASEAQKEPYLGVTPTHFRTRQMRLIA